MSSLAPCWLARLVRCSLLMGCFRFVLVIGRFCATALRLSTRNDDNANDSQEVKALIEGHDTLGWLSIAFT